MIAASSLMSRLNFSILLVILIIGFIIIIIFSNSTDQKKLEIVHVLLNGCTYNNTQEQTHKCLQQEDRDKLENLESAMEKDFVPDPDHKFVPLNKGGVKTFQYVCFESVPLYSPVAVDINRFAFMKKIVIYKSERNYDSEQKVATSPSCDKPNTWPVTFRKGNIPDRFPMMPFPAYFVTASQPGNLYHLFHDTLS